MWRAQVITPAMDRASLSQPSPWSSPTRVPCCSERSTLKVNYHKRIWPRGVKRENRHDFVARALAQEPWSSLAELELYVSKRALLNREDGCCFCATGKWEFLSHGLQFKEAASAWTGIAKTGLAVALPSKIWIVVGMSFHFFESWSSQFRHGQKKIWNFKFESKLTPYLFNQVLQVSWGCCSVLGRIPSSMWLHCSVHSTSFSPDHTSGSLHWDSFFPTEKTLVFPASSAVKSSVWPWDSNVLWSLAVTLV